MRKSVRYAFVPFCLFFAAASNLRADDDAPELKLKPVNLRASVDIGQIVHGQDIETSHDYKWQFLRRTNIFVGQSGTIGEHAEFKVGQMGVFFYVLPEQDGAPHTRLPKFGLGASQAEFAYHFGNQGEPWGDLHLGIFPYKYNPDATNLGEYLLRSGTYPGFLVTGGWNLLNSANFQVQGASFTSHLWQDRLKLDFLLPMESVNPPMHSISPTLVATAAPFRGLELGAGAACNHCISAKPSKETPDKYDPSIQPGYMQRPTSIIKSVKHIPVADPTQPTGFRDSIDIVRDSTSFYTFQGWKLMGRISLDPKAMFLGDDGIFGASDLKIFAEMAVLGVKDYPFYYPSIGKRMPIMFGFNFPAFRFLDYVSLQGEYYDKLWTNDIDAVYEYQYPVPNHQNYDPSNGPETQAKEVKQDKWHWSVLAKKQAFKGVGFYFQAANDHLRTFDYNIKPIKVPITARPSDWYYLFRIEVGI
jgi:hypothetical protein